MMQAMKAENEKKSGRVNENEEKDGGREVRRPKIVNVEKVKDDTWKS